MAAPRTDAPAPSALVDDSPAAVVDAEVESKVGEEPAIVVDHLTFAYDKTKPVLRDVSLRVPAGARLLLVGDNGAGKTTLLKILAGRHMHPDGAVTVLGRSSFYDTALNLRRSYLGCDWGRRTVAFAGYGCSIQADIAVRDMMADTQRAFPERRSMLIDLLGVDLDWRMHQVSDGQRRRVQIFLQLLRPSELLLLDEITTDLDVITRSDFLEFLKRESEERGVTIVYATHIFDGLAEWFSHIAFMDDGIVQSYSTADECTDFQARIRAGDSAPLLRTVETWLRASKDRRRTRARAEREAEREEEAEREREGAKADGAAAAAGGGGGEGGAGEGGAAAVGRFGKPKSWAMVEAISNREADRTSMSVGLGNGYAPGRFHNYYG